MVRWGKCFARPGWKGQPRVEGGNVARQAGGGDGCVGFVGDGEITSGVLRLEYKIVASKDKDGDGMWIGLADASAPAQAGDCGRTVAWGYDPYFGEVWAFSNPVGAAGSEGFAPARSLSAGGSTAASHAAAGTRGPSRPGGTPARATAGRG